MADKPKENYLKQVIPAPAWLVESNRRQRLQQKPTLEEVRKQMAASAKNRADWERKQAAKN